MTTEHQLSDELDEARIVARYYRRGLVAVGCAAAIFIVLIIGGAVVGRWGAATRVDTGGLAAALILVGVAGTVAAAAWCCWWVDRHIYDYVGGRPERRLPSPAARLRAAERAYRNHILDRP